MSVDFRSCELCEDVYCDSGHCGTCLECDSSMCGDCYDEMVAKHGLDEYDELNKCDKCTGEKIDEWKLINLLVAYANFNLSAQRTVQGYWEFLNEKDSMDEGVKFAQSEL